MFRGFARRTSGSPRRHAPCLKAATIERCLKRIAAGYAGHDESLFAEQTDQDVIVLNLRRACEAAIDLAMDLVAAHCLGVPQEAREAFDLLVFSWL